MKPLERFANWFEFGSKFDQIAFSCNRSNEVVEITLSTLFPVKNTPAFTSKNYPLFFERILTELKSLFGSPSISDKKYIKGTTIIYAYSWQCDTMVVIATCSNKNKEASYNLTLFDMNLKKKQEVDMYQNPN